MPLGKWLKSWFGLKYSAGEAGAEDEPERWDDGAIWACEPIWAWALNIMC